MPVMRLTLLFGVVLLAACGEEETEATELGPAVPGEMRTVVVTDAKAQLGRALFPTCAACHGEEGEGRVGIGPALNSESFLAAASDDFLVRTIKNGRPGTTMIAWDDTFNDSQVEYLVSYIRSFRDVEPAELDESPLEGNPEAGEEIFGQICSACHGRTGAGYQETANGTGIGRKPFLDSVTNGYLRYIIEHGKSDTQMRGFADGDPVAVANLTEQQIEDVIAYLRESAW